MAYGHLLAPRCWSQIRVSGRHAIDHTREALSTIRWNDTIRSNSSTRFHNQRSTETFNAIGFSGFNRGHAISLLGRRG